MQGYGDLAGRVRWADALRERDTIGRGKLAQAVIDHEFDGVDRLSPLHVAALRYARGLDVDIEALHIAGALTIKEPEGFAFYAVYPELYAMAARALPPSSRRLVIGARSIGTTLGAVVANACDAAGFVTLRPVGHPFQRELRMDDALRGYILSFDDFAIVDEGPGLSGSTFGCIADFLEDHGVAPERIVFFPSHANMPGNQASARHRQRWERATKLVMPFEELLPSIVREAATLAGPVEQTIDIGGGAWRDHVAHDERPPSTISREMRKYLLHAGGRRYLMKFAGLGRIGEEKLEKGRRIGLPLLGNANGFLVSEWIEGRIADPHRDRAALLAAVRRHLASLYESDNRMHRWEWIVTPSGDVVKTDALDHAHWLDGLGPQEQEWDVAGAVVELGLRELADRPLPIARYVQTQIERCEQTLSEGLPDGERALWERELRRYRGMQKGAG
jgi:hypothetical protein